MHGRVVVALTAFTIFFSDAVRGAEPPVRLTLDWGERMQMRVHAVKEKRGTESSTFDALYTARVVRTSTGYRADFDDLQLTVQGVRSDAQWGLAVLNGVVLAGDVTAGGELVELKDFEGLQGAIRELYREHFAGRGGKPEDVERVIMATTTKEILQGDALRTWNALLGWNGAEAAPGSRQVSLTEGVTPIVRRPIPMRLEWSILGREKCSTDHTTATCVRLRSTLRPDPDKFEKTMAEWANDVGMGAPMQQVRELDFQETVELLTEPGTLKPHWAKWSRQFSATVTESGKPGRITQTDSTTMTFSYPAGAK